MTASMRANWRGHRLRTMPRSRCRALRKARQAPAVLATLTAARAMPKPNTAPPVRVRNTAPGMEQEVMAT